MNYPKLHCANFLGHHTKCNSWEKRLKPKTEIASFEIFCSGKISSLNMIVWKLEIVKNIDWKTGLQMETNGKTELLKYLSIVPAIVECLSVMSIPDSLWDKYCKASSMKQASGSSFSSRYCCSYRAKKRSFNLIS